MWSVTVSETVGFIDTACKIKHGALTSIPVVTDVCRMKGL